MKRFAVILGLMWQMNAFAQQSSLVEAVKKPVEHKYACTLVDSQFPFTTVDLIVKSDSLTIITPNHDIEEGTYVGTLDKSFKSNAKNKNQVRFDMEEIFIDHTIKATILKGMQKGSEKGELHLQVDGEIAARVKYECELTNMKMK